MLREQKEWCILAHPRSGTRYIKHVLQLYGVDIGHEIMGPNGISSWLFAIAEQPRWGPDPCEFEFRNRVHLVREPMKVLSSAHISAELGVLEYIDRIMGIDLEFHPLRRAVHRYLAFDRYIKARHPNIFWRLEEIEMSVAAYFHKKKSWIKGNQEYQDRIRNVRKLMLRCSGKPEVPDVTFKELAVAMRSDRRSLQLFAALSCKYGYYINGATEILAKY